MSQLFSLSMRCKMRRCVGHFGHMYGLWLMKDRDTRASFLPAVVWGLRCIPGVNIWQWL